MSVSSGMDSPAPETSSPHATTVEASAVEASAAAEAATTTAPGRGVVRNQACAYYDQRGQCSQ
jgi:hypothetical protein